MSLLLQIPRELRDKILEFVISCTVIAPPSSPNDHDGRQSLKDTFWMANSGVLYQKDTQMRGIPTLAINRQIRTETLDVMTLMQLPSLRSYKLDVMIVEEWELWPTWLYVPTTTTRVEEVRATFRIFGVTPRRRSGYCGGDGGPPSLVWTFLNLIGRFLHVGPVSKREKVYDKHIKIRHLILDFLTPDGPEEMIAPAMNHDRFRLLRKRTGIKYLKNPRSVLTFVKDYLGYLRGDSDFGSKLYERVGKVTLMLDGVVVHESTATECILRDNADKAVASPSRLPLDTLEPVFEYWELKREIQSAVPQTENEAETTPEANAVEGYS
ncbi:hypothetical protein ONS95_000333 [Cadophora gregata]|uniref:uncharacterized protein n=1 Tax=Cadophora gregata TaxID=51156 RepID=UPI0026DD4C7D|nr:uncharacterized protein ONS95_000333 [Cadophora gregata]KAK0125664.1 hypothetical protein ONS96_009497 [Cadophora gregata f. sp. sojae]KAK0128361.1 hypothetical protein ONS95_000333 [Cadophora gregata]